MKTVQMATINVLVVDDFKGWQDFVKACLYEKPDMHIAGFATTAAEAIQKAKGLQPDLVILDISLPGPDGIEAARQIRTLTPRSRILFLSGSSDPEVVRQAIMAGGDGYVLKWDAALELVAGVEAVLLGQRFISSGLADIGMVF
jgi:DNA-binding NarL/FixJ family response regulator